MKKINTIVTVLVAILVIAVSFAGGIATERAIENEINFNTYCEKGTIVQKIEDEYLLLMDNGHYFSFYSDETFSDNTVVTVTFDYGETDKIEDDIIIAVSINLYEMAESLFTEWLFP